MPFSSLFCCSSNNVKRTYSDDEPAHSKGKSLPPQVRVTLNRNSRIASYQFVQDVIPPPVVSLTNTTPATIPPPKPAVPSKNEPYTPQRSLSLFQSYADKDNPNVIGPESFETLCTAANIPLDGSLPLILAWQMQAKEMAKISKDEWVKATESLKRVFFRTI